MGFKNILCGIGIPDAYGWKFGTFPCQRHKNHLGKHTRKFEDGWRVWDSGSKESVQVTSLKGVE